MTTCMQSWRSMATATPSVDVIGWNPCGTPCAMTTFSTGKIADGSATVPDTAYSGMKQVTGTTATCTLMLAHSVASPIRIVAVVSPTQSFTDPMRREYICPLGSTSFPAPPGQWLGLYAYDTSGVTGFGPATFTLSNVTVRAVSLSTVSLTLNVGGGGV